MKTFIAGQVWISEAEPELGLGFVREQDAQSVVLSFPAAEEDDAGEPSSGRTRRYGKRSAPLKRLEFRLGESVQPAVGAALVIERIEVRDGLNWYCSGSSAAGREVCERDLSPKLRLQRPLQRFLAGQFDPLKTFELRRDTLELRHRLAAQPSHGLLGPRAQLLAHQLYVVDQVSSQGRPRALLADEVGLGKTIEAGWILHRLAIQGRVRRSLIIVPKPLINQWFVELLRRFNLSYWIPESHTEGRIDLDDLATRERVILSLEAFRQPGVAESLATTGWDLIIVDEAHRVAWAPGNPSPEYRGLERLALGARALLLLTATPEALGLEGHFARLKLIDPARFGDWDSFRAERSRYNEIAKLAQVLADAGATEPAACREAVEKARALLSAQLPSALFDQIGKMGEVKTPVEAARAEQARRQVLLALIDRFGTGRCLFRNSRRVVELEHCFFPKRRLRAHRLDGDPVAWLGRFARERRGEKTLLICAHASIVIELEKRLREEFGLVTAAFHEQMPLVSRDRAAAYFEDPDGASILLSSEIGGEGRNFQHASHLVMADLPIDPEVIEQRIGRLDRIGSRADIEIHVPYTPGTREELLLRWHNEVFGAFDAATNGAGAVYERHRGQVERVFSGAAGADTALEFDDLLKLAAADYRKGLEDIERGRDRLVEINSFNETEGTRLAAEVARGESPGELRGYFERVLDVFGVSITDLDSEALFVEGGDSMYSSYFPALPADGIRLTFSRAKALVRDDLALMSWDHPMLTETIDAIVSREAGNAAVASWTPAALAARPELASMLVIECRFELELAAAGEWFAAEFAPAAPIRVVLDGSGRDLATRLPENKMPGLLTAIPPIKAQAARRLPPEAMQKAIAQAERLAESKAAPLRNEAIGRMRSRVDAELSRHKALAAANGFSTQGESEWWRTRGEKLEMAFRESRVRLDSFLVVLPPALLK